MEDLNLRYYRIRPLIILILITSFIIDWSLSNIIFPLVERVDIQGLLVIRAPSDAAIIIFLLYLYNNYLWKCPLFNLLVTVPNLNGRYRGTIESTFKYGNDVNVKKECVLEITQTASRISLCTYFDSDTKLTRTYSESFIENIEKDSNGFYNIVFYYQNEGTIENDNLFTHKGVNTLKYHPDEKRLEGPYFNNRPNKGLIDVKFESNKLKGGC